jgi:hypothetical protein
MAIARFYIDTPSISDATREKLKALCRDPLIGSDKMRAYYGARITQLVRSDMYDSKPKEPTHTPSPAKLSYGGRPKPHTRTYVTKPMMSASGLAPSHQRNLAPSIYTESGWPFVALGLVSMSVLMALLPR